MLSASSTTAAILAGAADRDVSVRRRNAHHRLPLSRAHTPPRMEEPVRRRPAMCLLAAVAVTGGLAAAPAAQADTPLRYVALGDSYSAASGVLPPDPQARPECARSTANYPHVIASETGAQLADVTCGG